MYPESRKIALLALGANMPYDGCAPGETLLRAIKALQTVGFDNIVASPLYSTPCFPEGAGPDYVNAAVKARWTGNGGAAEALAALHRLETKFGRTRETRWGRRTLDLDLIAFDDSVVPDAPRQTAWRTLAPADQGRTAPDTLILPHPRLQDRAFVLVPLAKIAPDWRHPLIGATIEQLCAALPPADLAAITPVCNN